MISDKQIAAKIKACNGHEEINVQSTGKGRGSLYLVLRKLAGGVAATWVVRWKRDGKKGSKTLGRYPELSTADALTRYVNDVSITLSANQNPHVQVTKEDTPTVGRLFEAYVSSMEAKGRASWSEVERALLKGNPNAADMIGRHREAHEVTPQDITGCLGKIHRGGAPVQADRTRAYLSAAFNYGMKVSNDYTADNRKDWGIKVNPVTAVGRHAAAAPRDRNLTADELRAIWHGMDALSVETRCAVRVLIATGQRVRETLRVERHEVDPAAALWTMPKEKTKGKRFPHAVPLTRQAVEAMQEAMQLHPEGFLFRVEDRSVNRALRRIADRLNMVPFQTRDLRRTFKSRAHDAGVDRHTRDLIQQHMGTDTGSKHYDRADYLPQKREGMEKWERWLDENVINAKAPAMSDEVQEAA